jgi:hypothetical protein
MHQLPAGYVTVVVVVVVFGGGSNSPHAPAHATGFVLSETTITMTDSF